ncbi:PAS domain-containing protein [Methylobacterium aerolatum]|uniref:PAS domain-containing protein n=1 Tax=Methylobacterium aerolatum TaxID=418708 RepID=UPI002795E2DB|nr:PAS domain-containing protein [Methylobacterium aerolatum]
MWETDFDNGRTRVDGTIAALFGIDPHEAAIGLPLARYVDAVVPEDRTALEEKLTQVRTLGGMYVIEFRTRPTPTDLCWVLARGRYERNQSTGAMTGRGIIIDITESKMDGQAEDRALFFAPRAEGPSLNHVAALTLEARQEIDDLGEKEGSPLRRAVDALLWAVGRAITAAQDGLKRSRRTIN